MKHPKILNIMETMPQTYSSFKKTLLIAVMSLQLTACASFSTQFDKFKPEPTDVDVRAALPTPPRAPQPSDGAVYNASAWAEAAPSQRPTTDWISTFNDPTLTALIDEAMRSNANLGSARAQIDIAEANSRIARAGLLPTLGASAGISRTESTNDFITGSTGFNSGLNASWEIDLWGRLSNQSRQGILELEASEFDYAGARLSIAGAVANTWFDLLEADLLVDLSERDVATQKRAVRLTRRRFDSGLSGSSDVRLTESALANSQGLQALRMQIRDNTARTLEVLLRRYPADAIKGATELPILPDLVGAGIPEDILLRRPDLRAAEARLHSAGLSVDVARKNLLPRLTLTAGTNSSANSLGDFFDIDSIIANIAAGLTQPIFQGGRLDADVDRTEAILRSGLENYVQVTLNAYAEVENALNGERYAAIREDALEVSLDQALKAEQRLELRFSEGLASILQLLDAQSRRLSTESQLIGARKERLANRVRLHVALGGGELDVNTQTQP